MEQVSKILAKDSQALWVALHRSLAHKMDYHLSLCYPSDIFPAVESRKEQVLGFVFLLNLPVDTGHIPIQKLPGSWRSLSAQSKARLVAHLAGAGAKNWRRIWSLLDQASKGESTDRHLHRQGAGQHFGNWYSSGRGQQRTCTYRAV